MPQFDWQTVAALAVVAWALVYIAGAIRRTLQKRRTSATACGSCGSCATSTAGTPKIKDFVALDALNRRTS
jgi:hypothetical protein